MEPTTLDIYAVPSRPVFLADRQRSWGSGLPPDRFEETEVAVESHPWFRRQARTLILRDAAGENVSALQLLAVRALVEGEETWLGVIRRIVTPERLRRRGFASALLRGTLDLLRREGIRGACLWSDIDPAFFQRFGFDAIETPAVETDIGALPSASGEGSSVRAMRSEDGAAVRAIHRAAASGASFWFLRDEDQWDFQRVVARQRVLGKTGADPAACDLILEEGTGILGYLLALTHGSVAELLEFGLARREGAWLERLLGSLKREASARGVVRLAASWPPGPWGDLAAAFLRPSPRREGVWMVASLDPRLETQRIGREGRGFWLSDWT